MKRGEIIYTKNGEMYILVRTIPEQQLKNPDMGILKQFFHCDTVLRNENLLYFCNHIKSIEYEEL
tara:strand:+ start:280 stop:474 length:195 start_codon:yes stop_codon:yes gene_type:complete